MKRTFNFKFVLPSSIVVKKEPKEPKPPKEPKAPKAPKEPKVKKEPKGKKDGLKQSKLSFGKKVCS